MQNIENYNAWKWQELWEVLEYRNGAVFKTRKTGYHVPSTWAAPEGWVTTSISTNELRNPFILINPHPTFK